MGRSPVRLRWSLYTPQPRSSRARPKPPSSVVTTAVTVTRRPVTRTLSDVTRMLSASSSGLIWLRKFPFTQISFFVPKHAANVSKKLTKAKSLDYIPNSAHDLIHDLQDALGEALSVTDLAILAIVLTGSNLDFPSSHSTLLRLKGIDLGCSSLDCFGDGSETGVNLVGGGSAIGFGGNGLVCERLRSVDLLRRYGQRNATY